MEKHIINGLQAYIDGRNIPWHMPGHKRKGFNFCAKKVNIPDVISEIYGMDVTEVYGLDDLHMPEEMIDVSEKELSKVYGTYASYYLVNGATCGVMAAIAAVYNQEKDSCTSREENLKTDKIIVAKNCHKSVINTAQLLGLGMVCIEPDKVGNDLIYGRLSPEKAEEICITNPDAKAMVITSPTYEGVISDVKAIADIVHRYNILLIVDEAHGAHLPFMYERKSECASAIYKGADIVIHGLHKTLPAMTQTAILHVINPALDEAVRKYKSIFMSSSPSYVMLCSMELAVAWAASYDYKEYLKRLTKFRQRAAGFKNFTLLEMSAYDISRIVFLTKQYGNEAEKRLRNYGIICEMSGVHHIVLISTSFDSEEDFGYLYDTLNKVDGELETAVSENDDIARKKDSIRALIGKCAEDNIYVYPPGSCIVVKGEIIGQGAVDTLLKYCDSGKKIRGL